MFLEKLSYQELGILLATKYSENMQTTEQLALSCEAYVESAQKTIDVLVEKDILEPLEQWDGSIGYGFSGGWLGQAIYDEIYGPLEA